MESYNYYSSRVCDECWGEIQDNIRCECEWFGNFMEKEDQ